MALLRQAPYARPGGLCRKSITIVMGLVWLLASLGPLSAETTPSREYQVKAVFLFNFLQFTEWPATAFADKGTPLHIGILGDNPFGTALEDTVRNETVSGRRLTVRHSRQIEDLKDCHLIFVCKSEKNRLVEILTDVQSASVLTVSEIDGFAGRGGIINFYPDGKKVRFEINASAAEHHGIKLSSQLLSLGRIVGDDVNKERSTP